MPFGETTLHAATAEQDRDAPFDAGSKALPFLESGTPLLRFAFGSFLPGTLRNAHHLNTVSLARFQIRLAEKAPIGTVQFWGVAEGFLVAFQGRFHLLIIARIPLEHFVLCEQPLGTFAEKNFVAELDRCLQFAALDQIRMGFKDGIDLFGSGNLFFLEHATAGLVNHMVSQLTLVVDLLPEFADGQVGDHILAARSPSLLQHLSSAVDYLFGYSDQLAIVLHLPSRPLLWCHSLDFLHPTSCRASAIAKPLNTLSHRCVQAQDQARDHAYDIP